MAEPTLAEQYTATVQRRARTSAREFTLRRPSKDQSASDSTPEGKRKTEPRRRAKPTEKLSTSCSETPAPPAPQQKPGEANGAHALAASVITSQRRHVFITGDSLAVLDAVPDGTVDCVVTSPPYFNQRIYDVSPRNSSQVLGNESTINSYIDRLQNIFSSVRRVLADSGSLWLNLGDKFVNKELVGVPWRAALALKDDGWILRQDIIWNQMKGTQSAKDRMRHIHEHVFHFVKQKDYFFDADSIRQHSGKVSRRNGTVVSATGVTGRKYYQQIRESSTLSSTEKRNAELALDETIKEMERGEIVDFRMTIRGVQRIYHSDNGNISGRARELETNGYFIMKMSSKGFLPSSIWNIVPEDEWRHDSHCAVFPKELVRIPILCTCPADGIVLDPFSGTGTTVAAAVELGRRGIGIDISASYSKLARARVKAIHAKSRTLFDATPATT